MGAAGSLRQEGSRISPTSTSHDEDRSEALRRVLAGLARGADANQLSSEIAELHVRHNTSPGEVFMELAADALDTAGVDRETGVAYQELLSTHLPEAEALAQLVRESVG